MRSVCFYPGWQRIFLYAYHHAQRCVCVCAGFCSTRTYILGLGIIYMVCIHIWCKFVIFFTGNKRSCTVSIIYGSGQPYMYTVLANPTYTQSWPTPYLWCALCRSLMAKQELSEFGMDLYTAKKVEEHEQQGASGSKH